MNTSIRSEHPACRPKNWNFQGHANRQVLGGSVKFALLIAYIQQSEAPSRENSHCSAVFAIGVRILGSSRDLSVFPLLGKAFKLNFTGINGLPSTFLYLADVSTTKQLPFSLFGIEGDAHSPVLVWWSGHFSAPLYRVNSKKIYHFSNLKWSLWIRICSD